MDWTYGSSSKAVEMDTLDSAYQKIVEGRTAKIRTFHSDVYYIQHLINHKFNRRYTASEVNELMYQEGLLKWSEYVPTRYVALLSSINFRHIAETRPDYNQ